MLFTQAPPLDVSEWVNAPPQTLDQHLGKVVVLETFQMLCPGCVSHGLPMATRIHRSFDPEQLVVLGVHTVFEHHDVMTPDALRVFLHEYKIPFPVAVDRPQAGAIPATMERYQLGGTPSTVLIDRAGRIRHSALGAVDDFTMGVRLGGLLAEAPPDVADDHHADHACTPDGCTPTDQQ